MEEEKVYIVILESGEDGVICADILLVTHDEKRALAVLKEKRDKVVEEIQNRGWKIHESDSEFDSWDVNDAEKNFYAVYIKEEKVVD